MSGAVITTAGRSVVGPQPKPESPRRAALREVRRVMRDPSSSDSDVEDALEALIELSHAER